MAIEREEDKEYLKTLLEKVHGEDFGSSEYEEVENRNPYQRDYARIMYSPSFRRLQGKMQILGVDNTAFFRNRLTHSMEVSQIATSILLLLYNHINGGKSIPIMDYLVLEAAALAHDIGHPAFGHSGERVLSALGSKYGLRFEGNAHNFRVLRTIEKKLPTQKGLNLTYRTLLAINKYIIDEDQPDSKGNLAEKFMFKDDYNHLMEFRKKQGIERERTIDVQIIELADDIAYAVHDLEDGLSSRAFNIDELIYTLKQQQVSYIEDFENIVKTAREEATKSCSYRTDQEYSQVFRQTLTSLFVKLLLSDLSLESPSDKDIEKRGISKDVKEISLGKYENLCTTISKQIFKCITREPNIAIYEARGRKVITDLFELFTNQESNKKGMLFPPDFRVELDKAGSWEQSRAYAQAAIDYIAGMMDDYAKSLYKHYFKTDFDEIDFRL